jgi:hypothetical protein
LTLMLVHIVLHCTIWKTLCRIFCNQNTLRINLGFKD